MAVTVIIVRTYRWVRRWAWMTVVGPHTAMGSAFTYKAAERQAEEAREQMVNS